VFNVADAITGHRIRSQTGLRACVSRPGAGSLIERDGKVVYRRMIGKAFAQSSDGDFHGRPSATEGARIPPTHQDGWPSSTTNRRPKSGRLEHTVRHHQQGDVYERP